MLVGESAQARVFARSKWNDTGVRVVAGTKYRFSVRRSQWIDWFVPSTPDGKPSIWLGPFLMLLRAPTARWFALMGRNRPSALHAVCDRRRRPLDSQ